MFTTFLFRRASDGLSNGKLCINCLFKSRATYNDYQLFTRAMVGLIGVRSPNGPLVPHIARRDTSATTAIEA
jgi:hypothetical protein